jgi:hypothetical protein
LYAASSLIVEGFPQPGMASTLPGQQQKLKEIGQQMTSQERATTVGTLIDEPNWGQGAFLETAQKPGNSEIRQSWTEVDVWLPSMRVVIERPGTSSAVATSATRTGEKIGTALSSS